MQSLPTGSDNSDIRVPDQGSRANDQANLNAIRTALSKAAEEIELFFIYANDRNPRLFIAEEFLVHAREVARLVKIVKSEQ